MRTVVNSLFVVTIAGAGLSIGTSLQASPDQGGMTGTQNSGGMMPGGSMMGQGAGRMMGRESGEMTGMMQQMARMMESCNSMMESHGQTKEGAGEKPLK